MPVTLIRSRIIIVGLLVACALAAAVLYTMWHREGAGPSPAPTLSSKVDQTLTPHAPQPKSPDRGSEPLDSPLREGDPFDQAVYQLLRAVDAKEWDRARSLSEKLMAVVQEDVETRYLRLSFHLGDQLKGRKTDDEWSARYYRSGYLYLAFPDETRSGVVQDLFADWKLPLAGESLANWTRVDRRALEIQAHEALSNETEKDLCRAILFAVQQNMRADGMSGADLFAELIARARTVADEYVCDPVLSWLLRDTLLLTAIGMFEESDYDEVIRHLEPLVDDTRFSERLRMQIRMMLRPRQSLPRHEILAGLRAVKSRSEAASLVGMYLNDDPQLKGNIGELLAILLERLGPADTYQALLFGYGNVSWLSTPQGADALALAIAGTHMDDTDDAFYIRIRAIAASARNARLKHGGGLSPVFFSPGTIDAEALIRQWIGRIPDTSRGWASKPSLLGDLCKLILDAHLPTARRLELVEELARKAKELYPVTQMTMLWRLWMLPKDELIANQDAVMGLWERIVTAPFEYHENATVARGQRKHAFEIWRRSEQLLTLFGYPRVSMEAERALLDRYEDAMALGSDTEALVKLRSELDVHLVSLVEAGYFQ
jgi:hypothetical protein